MIRYFIAVRNINVCEVLVTDLCEKYDDATPLSEEHKLELTKAIDDLSKLKERREGGREEEEDEKYDETGYKDKKDGKGKDAKEVKGDKNGEKEGREGKHIAEEGKDESKQHLQKKKGKLKKDASQEELNNSVTWLLVIFIIFFSLVFWVY
jgi:hypothetical protein